MADSYQELGRVQARLRRHGVTLFYHFVKVEAFQGGFFDWAVCLLGSGAPRLLLPVHSTRLIKRRLQAGWTLAKTIRLGRDGKRLWLDFLFAKERPLRRAEGQVVGMDSNYKNGLVFSDGQVVGPALYQRIQALAQRQKHTHAEIKSLLGQALKSIDFAAFKTLWIEDLKRVKSGTRGTFSRRLNRRLIPKVFSNHKADAGAPSATAPHPAELCTGGQRSVEQLAGRWLLESPVSTFGQANPLSMMVNSVLLE